MPYYKTCPDCGAHLDPGERCDCKDDTKEDCTNVGNEIKIEADAAVLKAIDKLTTALEKNAVNISVSQDTPAPVAPVVAPVTPAPVPPVTTPPATVVPTQPTPAPVATPTPAPAPVAPAQTVAPTNPAPAVPVTTAPTYTLDQIAKAGASLVDAGKMEQLLALLAKYGVQAVTQLQPDQYGVFATELRTLGAQL